MAAEQGRRGRRAAVAVTVLVVLAGVVVLLWPAPKKKAALPPPPPPSSSAPAPSPSAPKLPYPWFAAGTCYDHPQLSKVITSAEARPCTGDHDAEAIANVKLPEGLTTDLAIGRALRELCKAPAAEWQQRQGGGTFYTYPVTPDLTFYTQGYRDATCGLAVSNHQDGEKLHAPLR
ncbi:hypothetical protein CFP65_1770 [Kitasatospora sp. MMS16-BH015]|uniref:hypothetical protein n=1 Tax=Kitasatospora sp. MMS16-BH015 TaxID=2018025 RepID=UPI000CA13A4A|nr:hypothetical protein [Kitasatospora sp. MMS16-BH015]AUG76647.1 hypothetical protein CFP65_1770 [Kitasatospora sp. MMS16-BH015]